MCSVKIYINGAPSIAYSSGCIRITGMCSLKTGAVHYGVVENRWDSCSLKDSIDVAVTIFSGSLFQVLIVDGKNEWRW